ncbi:HipA domain-containing protein [Terrimonas ferruginea]|uniref:HipA domain-containing protein n=1 Tax=Terrimonas ferruginea TaxID=249 RepID=UPI00048CBCFF|nr:HipA domain-containing protein [Terrimonas ferruginea]
MNGLRIEKSMNTSGKIFLLGLIPLLKESDYYTKDYALDGDAPKQFIKAYFFEANSSIRRTNRSSWPAYIAKTAEKWYPHESVIEYMINRIGQELGLRMNDVKLVVANKQIRFLSRFFLRKDEKLIHGAEICGQYLDDMPFAREIAQNKDTARDLFTFEFIRDAIRTVFPDDFEEILCDLVKMIVFDGLVGNNDRHFYNWGVINTVKKSNRRPIFAPLYDSARGLLWNLSDKNISNALSGYQQYVKSSDIRSGKKVVNYIEEAAPRISIEDNKAANHFELIDFVKRIRPEYAAIVNELSSVDKERKIAKMLKKDFFPMFEKSRQELLSIILMERFTRIRKL